MNKKVSSVKCQVLGLFTLIAGCWLLAALCFAESVSLGDLPSLPKETQLFLSEKLFGYRGKVGSFVFSPCRSGTYFDKKVSFRNERGHQAVRIMYRKNDKNAFCGSYIILMADLSGYKTLSFMIKGRKGGESFEIGINDVIANKREDAVFIGSVNRYLPKGVTTKWQEVRIPLSDFYGLDLSKTYSLIFSFNDISEGMFWVDDIKFFSEDLVSEGRAKDIKGKSYLLLDNFDYSDMNLLGRKANTYKKLPSVCLVERVAGEHFGAGGKALKIYYKKDPAGWCGYYTMLNQIDGEYYDLSAFKSVSFMVKGQKGGEKFEIGMADKNWLTIGDSLKAGPVDKYLPGRQAGLPGRPAGVTTKWREVRIPLEDFGLLDLTQMGSFAINFNENGEGTIYIDDLKFNLK